MIKINFEQIEPNRVQVPLRYVRRTVCFLRPSDEWKSQEEKKLHNLLIYDSHLEVEHNSLLRVLIDQENVHEE